MEATRWCPYCGKTKPNEGFKIIHHFSERKTRRYMCPACQDKRKLSREAIDKLTEQERLERKRR